MHDPLKREREDKKARDGPTTWQAAKRIGCGNKQLKSSEAGAPVINQRRLYCLLPRCTAVTKELHKPPGRREEEREGAQITLPLQESGGPGRGREVKGAGAGEGL